jgi:glycerol uptake facilitator-like aquaporin
MSAEPADASVEAAPVEPVEAGAEVAVAAADGGGDVDMSHNVDDTAAAAHDPENPSAESKEDTTASKQAKRWILGRALLGEFLCTFIFLFIAMAVPWNMTRINNLTNLPSTEAIAVSFIGVAVIYSFADISGAHFNPAVTFATVVTGKMTWKKGCAFVAAQLLGSVWAAFWFIVVFPDGVRNMKTLALTPNPEIGVGHHIMMEFTLTFFLIYVIFSVAFDTVDSKNVEVKQIGLSGDEGAKNVNARNLTIYTASGNTKAGFAPIAIGFTLGLLSLVGGSVSGGAYNPARVFGAAMCSGIWDGQWVYWIGDLLGAAAGGWMQILFQRLKKYAGTK